MIDTPRHKGQRSKLVKELIAKGIRDERVLRAIELIPRHLFLDSSFEDFAYQDKAFPIAAGQTISQPFTVAAQSEMLKINKGDRVLEIGTGSGYQASVLHLMQAKVHSIERQKELFDITKPLMQKLGYNFLMKYGDGYQGLPTYAPFDKIIVTAGAPDIPIALLRQLKIGGTMVIPVGTGEQVMKLIYKRTASEIDIQDKGIYKFVPMLESKGN